MNIAMCCYKSRLSATQQFESRVLFPAGRALLLAFSTHPLLRGVTVIGTGGLEWSEGYPLGRTS